MTAVDPELDAEARKLYESTDNQVKPTWDQLGEDTKIVWRSYALCGQMVNM